MECELKYSVSELGIVLSEAIVLVFYFYVQ